MYNVETSCNIVSTESAKIKSNPKGYRIKSDKDLIEHLMAVLINRQNKA